MTLCINIGYSEPTRAESREGSSGLAESSWVTQYSKLIGCQLSCSKIGYTSGQCNKIGYSSAQCIKIGYGSIY